MISDKIFPLFKILIKTRKLDLPNFTCWRITLFFIQF